MDELKPGDKISTIPFDAVINVPISGAFYSRMQASFFALLQEKMNEDPTGELTNKLLKELESREPANLWEMQVTVLLALLYAAENTAKEAGILRKEDAINFIPKATSQEASPES